MTYFEKFRRRFFKELEKLLINQNRVYNSIPERFKNTATKDVITYTLGSLRQEILKIFDQAKEQTQKEKKTELTDIDKTRQFLKEVFKIEENEIKVGYDKNSNKYELLLNLKQSTMPGDLKGFVFDKNKKFMHILPDK